MIDPRKPDYQNTPVSPHRPRFEYAPIDGRATPLVTIITPFYNAAEVFHETARSVLQQSFQQWEWLIIDDASTDQSSLAMLSQYRDRDPRIRIIRNERNLGLPGTRNAGFAAATTQYVMMLDDDDLLEPTAVEKMLWFLLTHPRYAAVTGWTVGFGGQQYLWPKGFDCCEQILSANCLTSIAMVRRSIHQSVGGFDASIRDGMEDWEFWLRLADRGLWGATIPEYMQWYRRRPAHSDRWASLDDGERQRSFGRQLRSKYPKLYKGGFPKVEPRWHMPMDAVPEQLLQGNALRKSRPRILMILPWLTLGGADKFNRDLVEQLTGRNWEVTIATTLAGDHSWAPEFARYTPDVFPLYHFLLPPDQPAFLRYLIESRRPDVVLVSNSEFGYLLLPYLRTLCPEPAYVDFCHMEEEHWKGGGYPRFSAGMQEMLDLGIVSSQHLKSWMARRGADPGRIEVCYTNIDAKQWERSDERRLALRRKHGIDDGARVILYAARICPQKQPEVFADVMGELARRKCGFLSLVAGDGEQRPWLERYVRKHGLSDRVRMLGPLPNQTVQELMMAADIFFLPSQWEGIALSIYEAMAVGLSVVGAAVGGQRELVEPGTGFLIERSTPAAETAQYADILARLLANPAEVQAIGQRARQRIVQQFPLDAMGSRMVDLFERARALKKTSPRPSIPRRYALECATQAVEYVRLNRTVDELWIRQRTLDRQEQGAADATGAGDLFEQLRVQNELAYIENSRTWQLVLTIKRNPLYRLWARSRYGPAWDAAPSDESPMRRLDRIRKSRYFRLVRAVRQSRPYGWYARHRYGPSFVNLWR